MIPPTLLDGKAWLTQTKRFRKAEAEGGRGPIAHAVHWMREGVEKNRDALSERLLAGH